MTREQKHTHSIGMFGKCACAPGMLQKNCRKAMCVLVCACVCSKRVAPSHIVAQQGGSIDDGARCKWKQ